jgi:hypothetical protein
MPIKTASAPPIATLDLSTGSNEEDHPQITQITQILRKEKRIKIIDHCCLYMIKTEFPRWILLYLSLFFFFF